VLETGPPLAPPHLVNDFVRNVRKRVRYITLCESSIDDDGKYDLFHPISSTILCASASVMSPSVSRPHRYLMSRLSLQVLYLWRHVLSTAPPFILWWVNLKIQFAPLHRLLHRRAALSSNSNGTLSVYSSLYCEISMVVHRWWCLVRLD
jgi:hypothetical protein